MTRCCFRRIWTRSNRDAASSRSTGRPGVSDGTTILGGDCKAGIASIMEALDAASLSGTARQAVQVVFTRGRRDWPGGRQQPGTIR